MIPHTARIGGLVLASTAFYAYVGQMVPQKEVLPPTETAIRADLSTTEMATVGREIMEGKGLCMTCHTIGRSGALRFPDLDGIASRASTRVAGMNDVEYFAQSMYAPDSFIVPGFNPGMPAINRAPIGLTDQEILCVMAALQSLGGTPTITLQTSHTYYTAPGAPAGGAAAPPTEPGQKLPLEATNTTPGVAKPPAPPAKKGA